MAGWSPEPGVRLVTMAPELPGALEVDRTLAARGVVVSTGHSMATYDEAVAGFDAGARYGTHLFNAMPSLGHRDPGLPGALLSDDRMTVGFIADGIHTHRSIIDLVWRMLGPRRMNLVTDAMAALGMPRGGTASASTTSSSMRRAAVSTTGRLPAASSPAASSSWTRRCAISSRSPAARSARRSRR